MGLQNGISLENRTKHIRLGNKFDCVEGVTLGGPKPLEKENQRDIRKKDSTRKREQQISNPLHMARQPWSDATCPCTTNSTTLFRLFRHDCSYFL